MADDRTWTTEFHTDEIDGKHAIDEIIVAADLCEENGFDWVARWMRTARAYHEAREPQRKYGWAYGERSMQHFYPDAASASPAICGQRVNHVWSERRLYHWTHSYCQRCVAELERQKSKYRKAWAAHLDVLRELTGKEPTHAAKEG